MLVPGSTFTLDAHAREAFNQDYLITSVHHWGSQPQAAEEEAVASDGLTYHNTFEVIPASVPFRAPRLTPRPRVDGLQTR